MTFHFIKCTVCICVCLYVKKLQLWIIQNITSLGWSYSHWANWWHSAKKAFKCIENYTTKMLEIVHWNTINSIFSFAHCFSFSIFHLLPSSVCSSVFQFIYMFPICFMCVWICVYAAYLLALQSLLSLVLAYTWNYHHTIAVALVFTVG